MKAIEDVTAKLQNQAAAIRKLDLSTKPPLPAPAGNPHQADEEPAAKVSISDKAKLASKLSSDLVSSE